jgi:hypothetical protein
MPDSEIARMPCSGWGALAAWTACGVLMAGGFLLASALGLAPGVLTLAILSRRARVWPESIGVLAGLGAGPIFVGASLLATDPARRGGPPLPWVVSGAGAVAVSLVLFVVLRGRAVNVAHPRGPLSPGTPPG